MEMFRAGAEEARIVEEKPDHIPAAGTRVSGKVLDVSVR